MSQLQSTTQLKGTDSTISKESFTLKDLDSVYTGPDPFGTGTKLERISLVLTRDLAGPVRVGSAIWCQMGPLMKMTLLPCTKLIVRVSYLFPIFRKIYKIRASR